MKTVNPGIKVTDTCWTNMAQMLVGQITKASYSAHNDFEATIAIRNNEEAVEVMEDVFLPTQDNIIVITLILSNDPNIDNCYLRITHDDGKITDIPLSNFCFHVQGPKANSSLWKHEVVFKQSVMAGHIWWLSITFRLCIDGRLHPGKCEELLRKAL